MEDVKNMLIKKKNNFVYVQGFLFLAAVMLANLFPTSQAIALSVTDYQLGPGDRIHIRVYGEDELTLDTLLSDSGAINYPFLGELKVTGLTLQQLEELIVGGLSGDYLVKPIVHISIVEYRPFFIDGEVKVPGGYPFQPGLTIAKAAALAQGFTERASKEKIYIVRGVGENQEKMRADTSTQLMPGDIITVEQRFF